jgi:hypothetical protein
LLTYDAATGRDLLFGGYGGWENPALSFQVSPGFRALNDTWEYYAGAWHNLTASAGAAPPPTDGLSGSMTYDARDGYVVLYDDTGSQCDSDPTLRNCTWIFQNGTWNHLDSGVGGLRQGHDVLYGMTYDSTDQEVVAVGVSYQSYPYIGWTAAYRAGQWFDITNGTQPEESWTAGSDPSLIGFTFTDDPDAYAAVLATGYHPYGGVNTNNTWEFHAGQWTEVSTENNSSLPIRNSSAGAYFPALGGVVLFGGETGYIVPDASAFGLSNDTWLFRNDAWSNLTPELARSPPPLSGAGFCWDPVLGEGLLFGGSTFSWKTFGQPGHPDGFLNDQTWILTDYERYQVNVSEQGLARGINWSIEINGSTELFSASSDSLYLPNGTYSFQVNPVSGYTEAPRFGWIVVDGSSTNLTVVFSRVTFGVTFMEEGLGPGTLWAVNVSGQWNASDGSRLGFSLPNGTGYNFTVVPPASNILPSPRMGSFDVNGTSVEVNIQFFYLGGPPPCFWIRFAETGLPAGTNWSVTISLPTAVHTLKWGMNSSILVGCYGFGVYQFTVTPLIGFEPFPLSGQFLVNDSVDLEISFIETGSLWTQAGIRSTSGDFCQGGPFTVQLVASAGGGTPPYNFSWNFGNGDPNADQQNISHTYSVGPTSQGIQVNLTVRDSVGHTALATVLLSPADCPGSSGGSSVSAWEVVSAGLASLTIASTAAALILNRRSKKIG